jgi:molybdopterin/thiamine biosynthesis adenylyltransferase
VVLSGVKRFTIHDYNVVRRSDLSGQFFVTENDIGKNRALSSLEKIQQLNYYVRVDAQQCDQALPSTEAEIE